MGRTADKTTARNRARQALAEKQRKRREREERLEAAATRYFAAADRIEAARLEAGEAIRVLIDEGESRSEIGELLGITARDIRTALAMTDTEDDDWAAGDDGQSGVEGESARTEDETRASTPAAEPVSA